MLRRVKTRLALTSTIFCLSAFRANPDDAESMRRFAMELVALQPDVLLSSTTPPQRRCFNKRAPSPSFSRSLPTRSAAASSRTWRDLAAPLFRSSLGRRLAYFGSAPDARPVPMPSRASPDSTAPARRYLYPIVLRRVWGMKQRPRSNGQEATAMTADQRQGLDLSP